MMRVIVNDLACTFYSCVQARFPRNKKKRIRAKWQNRPGNYKIRITTKAIQIGDTLLIDSETYFQMQATAKEKAHEERR